MGSDAARAETIPAGLAACAARNPAPEDPVSSGALSRGANMTDALWPAVSMAQVRRDMRAARQAGLRHVRLPFEPRLFASAVPDADGASMRRLDAVVCAAVDQHLAVILDAHPAEAVTDATQAATIDRIAAAWDLVAARYAIVGPGLMVFEALNEPVLSDPAKWEAYRQVLLARIRRAAPRHTILLTASPDSTAVALAGSKPVEDRNVAYVFHFYSPLVFTHQGAAWATPDLSSIRGLRYPAEAENVASVRRGALPRFASALADYAARYQPGSSGAFQEEVAYAADWAARYHARLIVTEFGAYRAADNRSRLSWLREVRSVLEARGIGWTVWEYHGGFGIANDGEVPPSMRSSLGLHATAWAD